MKTLLELQREVPWLMAWAEIGDFDSVDERRSCVDGLYSNTIGVNDGYVEWSPNDGPPSEGETLAWLWFVRPDLGEEIAQAAPAELKAVILEWNKR